MILGALYCTLGMIFQIVYNYLHYFERWVFMVSFTSKVIKLSGAKIRFPNILQQ